MKKIFTAFLAFFLAFSPLLTVSPTVYSEAFDQTTATSEEQATTESGTTTKEAENGPEIPPIISSPPATEATTITEAPQPAGQEDTSTATESTTTESKPAVQPRSVFRNAVRSVPTTTNLSDLLADATVDAPTDSEGNYIVRPNGEYTISLQFAEKETLQMVNDQPLTYTVPAGFKLADVNNTFSIVIEDSQGSATLDGNTFNVTNNVLTVNFNKTNQDLFNRLSAMANVKFKLDFSGRFTGDVTEINFGSSIKKKFTFDQTSSLSITKEAEHVKSEGKAKYTLKVTSEGNNSEVVITDEIKGTALTPNNNVEVTSSISGKLNVSPVYAGKKFTLSNLSLQHGEILTITYSADINYNDITRTGLPEEVNNFASVHSKENPTPKTVEKPVRVEFDSITKTGTVPQKIPNEPNKYKVVWTATINKDRLMTVGGKKIIDYVSPSEKVHFTGTGIVINVTKEGGAQEVRNLSWDQLTVTRRAGDREIWKWEYTPPVADGKAMYVITTTTIADITGAIGNFNFNNNISIGKRVTTPNKIIDIGIGEDLKPKKEIVSYTSTEALWKITVPVRGEGYAMPVKVTDDLPYVDYKGVKYHDDPIDIEFQGLLPGESYALVMRTDGQYRGPYIEFFQDAEKKKPGLLPNPNGQRREIVILLKSTINQDWLELAHQSGYSTASSEIPPVHRNNASLRLGTSLFSMDASITPKKQTLKKTYKDFKRVDIGGVQYPVFSYELEFTNPLDGQVITDEFDVDYLKYYQAGTLEIKGRNAEGDEFDTNGTVTPQVTAKGVNFTLTNLPKNNGNYYTTYRLTYDLIVKDAQTLEKLNKEAFQNENNQGKVLNNIASWNGLRSENVSTIYNYNPKLDKKLIQVPSNANSYVATFELILNEEAADLFSDSNTYTAKDELSNVLRLLPETIQVTKGPYTLDYGFDAKTNTITFNNIPDGQEVRIVYSAHVLGSGNVSFANAVSMGQYRKVVSESVHIASSGSGSASNPSITIVKHDKDEFSKVIPGVTFKLSYSKNGLVEDVKDKNGEVVTFTTKADGSFLIEGNQTDLGWVLWADGRTYLLTEINTPTGYLPLEQPISFTILETPTNTSQYPITGGKIYVANERPKTRVEATKIWKNIGPGLAVPTTWFKLFRQVEGGPLEPVPNASIMTLAPGTTSVAWENVYAKDLNNKPYTFFVKEVDANGHEATPQDYLKEENGLQVTNTYDGRKEIEVTKEWDDNNNQDGKRPSEVTVHLYADGTKIQTAQITEANGWRHTFSNLPKFKDGREIVYTIQEDQVPEYKAPVIDGFTVKNKRTPEKTKVAVRKVWKDANNQDGIRPLHITVILKANGLEIDRKVLTAGPLGVWSHEFTNLDVYKNGVKVNYTVDEEVVPADYKKAITGDAATGFTITNCHTPVEKKVTFSKVDLGGQEIAGAKIKIYKGTVATGTPVAEWTSVEGQSHELSLPVGKYVFHEEAAPNGYVAVTDITFQVNYNGTVTVLDANSNTVEYRNGKLVITDKYDESPKKITFSKVNLGGDEVEGAEVEIYKGDTITGAPVEKWTSGTTPKELNLAPGTYVFHEEAAPEGLLKVTDITFKVNYDGTVTVTNIGEKDAKGEMNTVVTDGAKIIITDKTDDLPRKITFSKVNLGGDEVEGAEVEIYKGDTITGSPIEKWTSGTTPKELNLAPGTYVFHEEAAPEGLLKVTDITFKVNYDGTVTVTNIGEKDAKGEMNTVVTDGAKITITDKTDDLPRKITFSKVNLGGDEVEGAEVEIYAGDTVTGTPVEKWTSGTTPKELDLAPGTYVFHEEAAPEGLLKVTDITFKVNYDGTVTVTNIGEKDAKGEMNTVVTDGAKITITDKTDDLPRKITFSKVNLGGDEVEGAEVEIYAGDTVTGTPVEKWTSGTTPKELDLAPGTYVFHEEAAPEGLLKVTDITFKVNYDGTVTVTNIGEKDAKGEMNTVVTDGAKITITDKTDDLPRKITFSKVNLGGDEVEGAEVEIYKGDTITGSPIEKWTSGTTPKELNLAPGTYVFHEEAAPEGLLKVTDITFKVNYDGTVTVTNIGEKDAKGESNTVVTDGAKITITDKTDDLPRKITFSKVNLGGDEVEGAEVEIYAGDTVTGTPVEKWTSGTTPKELDLAPGTYVFHEEAAPEGLLKVTDITFKVNYDGTVTVTNIGEKDAKGESNTVVTDGAKITITDKTDDLPRKITFSKVNLGGEEIAGAKIQIFDEQKNQVAEWTSEAGKSKIIDLKPGKYVFHEEAAPNGYVAVTDITFQVNYDGTVTVLETNSNAVEYKDGKLVITDQYDESPKKITFSKVNLGGEEIAGAKIQIFDEQKNQVAEWTSEAGKSKIIDLKPGKYVFHEEAAPNGYLAVTDITFQVNYDGTVTVLETNSNAVEYKDGKLVITDQYDESTRSIKVQKIWKDNQNASKTRPDSITIRLFADGKEIAVATVKPDASGDWSHTFDKLPIYNKGVLVAYTVKEDKVNGYETSVGELKDGQIEVVNTYIPSKPKKNKVNLPKTGSTESALTLIVGLLLLGMAYTMKRKND